MKALLLIAIVGIAAYVYWNMQEKEARPVREMERLVTAFPSAIHERGKLKEIHDVRYNVKKTDSLINPLLGSITFATPLYSGKDVHYEMVFHWRDDRWSFSGLICTTLDVNRPLFESSMRFTPEIQSLILKGKVDPQFVSAALAREERERVEEQQEAAPPPPTPKKPGDWMFDPGRTMLDKKRSRYQ